MLSREVMESGQHVSVFDQSGDGLVAFYAVGCDKIIEGSFGIHTDFSL